jgi:hypothetical protein
MLWRPSDCSVPANSQMNGNDNKGPWRRFALFANRLFFVSRELSMRWESYFLGTLQRTFHGAIHSPDPDGLRSAKFGTEIVAL